MKYSYHWLKELVPKLPKPEKLAELLNLYAFEVESVEKFGSDTVLDISVLPNRIPDASGHIGMAREISALLDVSFSPPAARYKISKQQPKTKDMLSIFVEEKKLCRRYRGIMITGIEVKESPRLLRERLEACGQRSINSVVDATNYAMLLTGQPLHAFDYDKLGGGTAKKSIIVRSARDGEKITTLDGVDFTLRNGVLVIADDAEPLAIAGIKGGKKAEITENTKRIVLEAAVFDGPSIRKTTQVLGLRTDSSMRFSAGLGTSNIETAIQHACAIIEAAAGGVVLDDGIDVYPQKEKSVSIMLRLMYCNGLLGIVLSEKEIKNILVRLGCRVAGGKKNVFRVTPPEWRRDLLLEEDIIEEVGRVHGYGLIEEQHPLSEMVPPEENNEWLMLERARTIWQGIGFQETYNYSFTSERDISALGDNPADYLLLENPARPDCSYLRASLGPGLLKAASENMKHEDVVRLFESGNVFRRIPGGYKETTHVGGVMADTANNRDPLFFELKGAISLFFEHMGVSAWFDDVPSPGNNILHPHRSALIKVGDKKIGVMGEVHPRVRAEYGLSGRAALFEIDAEVLGTCIEEETEFRPIVRFPSIMRDIALLVPLDTRMVEVEDVIENTGGALLVDTDLIDMYAGPELPDNKKNFAFRLVFQSPERTLTDEEVNIIIEHIIKTLEETNPEWEVR